MHFQILYIIIKYYKFCYIYIYINIFYNRGTFYGQALKTLHGESNLGVLTIPQQPVPGKFKVSSVVGFEPKTMCHLLGPHFLVEP